MLAQSFLSPAELKLTDAQFDALRKTLVLLETGRMKHVPVDQYGDRDNAPSGFSHHFNMRYYGAHEPCGTVCCIAGTAVFMGADAGLLFVDSQQLHELFQPPAMEVEKWRDITPAQAARALRSYLTTGEANWEAALA